MRIYFLRHGDAEDRRAGLADPERRLTEEGIQEMRDVARGMTRLGLDLDRILTSPYLRARETAEIAAEALELQGRLREEPRLRSGCEFPDLVAALEGVAPEERVLVVGHEPDFSTLISTLIGGGNVRMRKAGLAAVEWTPPQPGQGELLFLLAPAHLVRLGKD